MPYADPSRAREAARERYARKKNDPRWREQKRASSRASYQRNLYANRAKKRRATRKSLYGLTDEALDQLLAVESCAVCGVTDHLVIDHDHATGVVRGVLCAGCNGALGWYERPGWKEAVEEYLRGD